MCDKHRVTEEPCEAKVSRTVLESGGSREGVADFNSQCQRVVKKALSTRTHACVCGCILHRDTNAAINILLKASVSVSRTAKSRGGHPQSNATGVGTATLLGESLVEQVLTLNVESNVL